MSLCWKQRGAQLPHTLAVQSWYLLLSPVKFLYGCIPLLTLNELLAALHPQLQLLQQTTRLNFSVFIVFSLSSSPVRTPHPHSDSWAQWGIQVCWQISLCKKQSLTSGDGTAQLLLICISAFPKLYCLHWQISEWKHPCNAEAMEIPSTTLQKPSAPKKGWIGERDGIRPQIYTGLSERRSPHPSLPLSSPLETFWGRGRCSGDTAPPWSRNLQVPVWPWTHLGWQGWTEMRGAEGNTSFVLVLIVTQDNWKLTELKTISCIVHFMANSEKNSWFFDTPLPCSHIPPGLLICYFTILCHIWQCCIRAPSLYFLIN